MSIMKKILAVAAAVSMLATSMVAYAAAPTVKSTLMTSDELAEYTDVAAAGIKVTFENFEGNLAALQMSVMIPKDALVEVNTGTAKKPVWENLPVSEENIQDAVDSSFEWKAVVLQGEVGDFYKYGFQTYGQDFSAEDAYFNIFFCADDPASYVVPENAYEMVDVNALYVGASSNMTGLVVENYFDGAVPPAPVDPTVTVDNDNAVVEEGEKADAKTWAVAVDGGYVAAGEVLVATLTKGDDTQVVNLTVGNDVVGGADWAFNLKVRFKDAANRALTTLAVAKAAN